MAVIRLQTLSGVLLLVLVLERTGGRPRALVLAVPTLAVLVQTGLALYGTASRGPGEYVLYQKNMLWNGSEPQAILDDILSVDPDFVTVQETSSWNEVVKDGLSAAFPHRLQCPTSGNGGIALYSRYPLSQPDTRCAFASGMVVALASLPDGRQIWVGSVHLNWPWPYPQADQVKRLEERLVELEGPMLIAGDFNMVPWGSSVRVIAKAAESERIGGYVTTFPAFGGLAPLAIDHVLIPKGGQGQIDTRPLLGSDHLGLVARFSF